MSKTYKKYVLIVGLICVLLLIGFFLINQPKYILYSNHDVTPISFQYLPSLVQISTSGANDGELVYVSPLDPSNPKNERGYNGQPGVIVRLMPCHAEWKNCSAPNSNTIISTSTFAGQVWMQLRTPDDIAPNAVGYRTIYQNILVEIANDAPENPVVTSTFKKLIATFEFK